MGKVRDGEGKRTRGSGKQRERERERVETSKTIVSFPSTFRTSLSSGAIIEVFFLCKGGRLRPQRDACLPQSDQEEGQGWTSVGCAAAELSYRSRECVMTRSWDRLRPVQNGERQRDDNKNKIFALEGGPRGQRGKSSRNAVLHGKRHDNEILKVQILLSGNLLSLRRLLNGAGRAQVARTSPAYLHQ